MARSALLAAAVTVALLAGGCARPTVSRPSTDPSGRLTGGGVTVVAVLATEPDGTGHVRVTFSPQKPGYHLYSIHLPPGGVNGLGIPTVVSVRDGLRVTGSPAADKPVIDVQIAELNVDLPVYPDGPVTVTVPVRRTGNGRAEVVVTYGACSATTCLPPVRNRLITLA
ncbi:MAG TPA: protein-disulfide reductase DsbD domain-containing protein [Streptosporangiaceae bacterium]|nr:protein-disulfide reductase DsbD domain-containing protein [Streptosporangiaceae bacterium]